MLMQGSVWTYLFALPLGWYPFGVPPDKGHTHPHSKQNTHANRATVRSSAAGVIRQARLHTALGV